MHEKGGGVYDSISILLCTPRPLLALGMAGVVAESPFFADACVNATASTRDEALTALRDATPGIVVIDERLPGFEDVITAAEQRDDAPDVVLVVADPGDERVRRFLVHGVIGVVPDTVEPRQLVATLLAVLDGQVSIPARLATLCFESQPTEAAVSLRMSADEVQLLRLLVESRSTREAAEVFHVSEATIKKRLGRLFRRISVNDRTQAAVWAIRAGLADQEPPPVVKLAHVVGRRAETWTRRQEERVGSGGSIR